MAQSFTVSTQNARQDAALAYLAAKTGVTVDQIVQQEFARVVRRAINERERDDAAAVGSAYVAATNNVQSQVKTLLGVP